VLCAFLGFDSISAFDGTAMLPEYVCIERLVLYDITFFASYSFLLPLLASAPP
jgi:hypothetical protein